MKKSVLLVFLSIASFLQMNAQNLPRTYVITSDTAKQQFLDKNYWQVLKDKKGSFTINEVRQPPLSNQFTYFNKIDTNQYEKTNWFRFVLKNESGKLIKISLSSIAGKTDFYIPDSNGVVRHYLTGRLVPWNKKDGFKKINTIPFEMKQGAQIKIYLKITNLYKSISGSLKFYLWNTEKLQQFIIKDYEENYYESSGFLDTFFSGVFLLAAIFNFLIFLGVREKVYLYFSLMLICFSLNDFIGSYNTLLRDYERTNELLSNLSFLWYFFLLQFIRHYFRVSNFYPRWDKILLIISGICLTVYVADIVGSTFLPGFFYTNREFFGYFMNTILIVFFLSLAITIIMFLIKRTPERRGFILAVSPFLLSMILLALIPSSSKIWINYGSSLNHLEEISGAWLVVVFSWFLLKRYALQEKQITQEKLEKEQLAREKEIQKSELIAEQKVELEKTVEERTSELRHSLEELKSTQKQLIQSEKMASLGELTAGIAHEIQNPLNFVNNFSDVNKEMLEELKAERLKPNAERNDNLEDEIIEDVITNEQKINHHGKRADAIVKGMLQHSRKSSGHKEPTDINALADEFLRLSYQGLRAKDKSFNATMETDFDESIGKINIIPQDIGRVLLNLFNNAFYAVNEQKSKNLISFTKEMTPFQKVSSLYEPTVSVTTKKSENGVIITVSDNGNGIPQKIVDKIFQPFFTTKPTGEGTGLGLSLSYDIIKAHGGEIKVESKEKEGTEFTIQLPVV